MKNKERIFESPCNRHKAIVLLLCGSFIIVFFGLPLIVGFFNNARSIIDWLPSLLIISELGFNIPIVVLVLLAFFGALFGMKMIIFGVKSLLNPEKSK
jgi:ABC-type dipeptide/oligopeptide/nickel transport system permease component